MINKEYIKAKGLEPHDVFYLGLVLQNATEDMTEELIIYLGDIEYRLYEELKLITHIKAKNKKEAFEKARNEVCYGMGEEITLFETIKL